jgi:NitT/TauT family transport system permease protein
MTGALVLLALWCTAVMFYPAYIIPAPWDVLSGISAYLSQDFLHHLGITLYRTMAGFSFALFFGTLLGLAAALKKWEGLVNALMLALQVMPGTILGVIFLLMFGLGSATPIFLVAFLTLPTLVINTMNGMSKTNVSLKQYLTSINSRPVGFLKYVYLPALIPVLQSNLSIGMGLAVKVVVLGEFIASQDGLGYLLNHARIVFNMKEVFFYLIILLIATLAFQAVQSLFFTVFFQKYTYAE